MFEHSIHSSCVLLRQEYERRRLELEKEMTERQETADKELQRQKEALQLEARSLEADKEMFDSEIKVGGHSSRVS